MDDKKANMAARYEHEIPDGYKARIEGNKVILEPKESEDERISEQIMQVLIEHDWSVTYKVRRGDCIAWFEKQKEQKSKIDACGFPLREEEESACSYLERCLAPDMRNIWYEACSEIKEKQKEQKPAEFPDVSDISEEELIAEYADVLYKTIRHYIEGGVDFTDYNVKADAEMNFFHLRRILSKALENRYEDGYQEGVASSMPAEWSEKDEKHKQAIIDAVQIVMEECEDAESIEKYKDDIDWLENRLKSLRSPWKPNKKQMETLKNCAYGAYQNGDGPTLRELYNDLEKLYHE